MINQEAKPCLNSLSSLRYQELLRKAARVTDPITEITPIMKKQDPHRGHQRDKVNLVMSKYNIQEDDRSEMG